MIMKCVSQNVYRGVVSRSHHIVLVLNRPQDAAHLSMIHDTAILFAAGRYNAFNFLSNDGDDQAAAVEFFVSEYRKAIVSNLEGIVGPVVRPQG